ncbi:fibropellin-1, partial [Nephila pilipes]
CKCDKGKCELKDGNTVCVCPPEFGNVTISSCKACECGKGANCTFESTGWFSTKKTCICPKGYSEVKEKCKGPCAENPCKNGGTCKDINNGFKCFCPSPYSGQTCETKADPCSLKPCKNGGTCTAKGSNFTCSCKSPYTGSECEKVDPCASNPCQNGGTCKVVGSNFTCSCKPPFNGTKCEN